MNTQLTTTSLAAIAAQSLSWLGDSGFKYFKSYQHFRRMNDTGFSYIMLNTTTHDRRCYSLALYLGVQIAAVEKKVKELYGQDASLKHYDRTIWLYTVNVGPESLHWKYPINGNWIFYDIADFPPREMEINTFVRDLALPYVANTTPQAIREILLKSPGHATNIYPYEEILTIDLLYQPHNLGEDIKILRNRYNRYAPEPKARFETFVNLIEKAKDERPTFACS